MRRIRIMGLALVVVLAVSAAAASAASASRLILSEEDGTALPLGQEILFSGRENLTVESSAIAECKTPEYYSMELYSTLDRSSRPKDEVKFKTGRLVGGVEEPTEVALECRVETGYAFVDWRPGGEILTLGANGKARLRPMSIGVLFEIYNYGRIEEVPCSYSKGTVSGTNTATATRQPLTVELDGTLTRRSSPRACPKTMHVSLSLPYIETYEGKIEEEI
jgi:hypothetical protein